jgi:hypothetical protein
LGPARLLVVVLVGNAELAKVGVTLVSVEESEVSTPAAVPLASVLSFVERHRAKAECGGLTEAANEPTRKDGISG